KVRSFSMKERRRAARSASTLARAKSPTCSPRAASIRPKSPSKRSRTHRRSQASCSPPKLSSPRSRKMRRAAAAIREPEWAAAWAGCTKTQGIRLQALRASRISGSPFCYLGQMRSTATAVVFAVLLSFSLAAQEQKLAETIEVRVANIDVVVTDRAGNPVTGLTKSDFELFENGKPQTITNFYEVRGNAELAVSGTGASASAPVAMAPDDIRARRFVLCIDNY